MHDCGLAAADLTEQSLPTTAATSRHTVALISTHLPSNGEPEACRHTRQPHTATCSATCKLFTLQPRTIASTTLLLHMHQRLGTALNATQGAATHWGVRMSSAKSSVLRLLPC